ncbi:inositol hexakisphosphate and diphosphoinositol-pentakisphosphate kinase 2-like isoform X7 [Haliotis rubra]|uniref:inositol hexakisphosphate and diphosphoinositol-pentakisphosphate kinase 2-like isoform X7 n=1 Tax=Haliotis rubra TaxID=36100 RepID=UPI001EE56043|nr:inositol hexakisphosphate and diphosphoinositol-pentakisphosphate kinase 2-like isoform X7 [Haliotis rubra]
MEGKEELPIPGIWVNVSSAEQEAAGGPHSPRVKFMIGDDFEERPRSPGCYERSDSADRRIVVGVCAMSKKAMSKPMREILQRLEHFERIQILVFEESVILNESIEDWPICDALISFYSHGFPLSKAIAYEKLRKPFVINDLENQYCLRDRRQVYQILVQEGIAHPRYAVLNRNEEKAISKYVQTEDSIEIDGVLFPKPFVEKPVDAEDHNIHIYFPMSAGGGSTRLFRKVHDRSSVYSVMSRVRSAGSYIYEDFMPTDGTDVKVYTVGPDYAHAEARKSPALDGKVERDMDGKEIRYPVILSAKEKMIAKKVCLAFKQNVCGFDLLRASGQSYVCDVNGFSFVKTSSKYYDDCAKILGTMIMRALAPQLQLPWVLGAGPEDIPVVPTTQGPMMELRCVSAIIRHGDRTPKQKMKMEVKHKKFFELFEKYGGLKKAHLKLKKPKQLQEVLDIVRHLLSESQYKVDPEVEEKKAKLQQLKLVLEMYGHFSGINRKVQIKYQPQGCPKKSSSEEDDVPRDPSLLLIVKWEGELTPAGKIQAEDLGKAFRTLYPGGQGQFESPGLGFLRLHSTFRHDLKIYASDEGRVQMTAAAFAKGLLALEGELTPILMQMVKSANNNGLLDSEGKESKYQLVWNSHQAFVKEKLKDIFNEDKDFSDEDYEKLAPTSSISLINAMKFVKNPRQMCERVHEMIHEITSKIRALKVELKSRDLKLYHGESWELLIRRWAKLEKDYKTKIGRFDISKIPDIYDCIKYDLQHNQKTLQFERAEELFMCSKALADIIIPQEYGITVEEKLHIAQNYCTPLMRKIRSDLLQCLHSSDSTMDDNATRLDSRYSKGVASPERFVRTRLYFTSESHIHSLLTMLRYGGLCDPKKDEQWKRAMDFLSATAELNYMTQIVLMMFEDPSKDPNSDERFHMELHFSPGAYTCCDTSLAPSCSMGYRPNPKSDKKEKGFVEGSIKGSASWQNYTLPPDPFMKPRLSHSEHQATIMESLENMYLQQESKPNEIAESNMPEWDWGTDDSTETKVSSPDTDEEKQVPGTRESDETLSTNSVSKPIAISRNSSSNKLSGSCPSGTNGGQNLDDKKSRSLDDKSIDSVRDPAYVQRHYKTVNLPLSSRQHHSFSSLFYLSTDVFKDIDDPDMMQFWLALQINEIGLLSTSLLLGSASTPDLMTYQLKNDGAFGGFGMVPSLRPLETLHNNLTFKDMDDFLGIATNTKFVTPIASPPYSMVGPPSTHPAATASGLPLNVSRVGHSLPSSSNSSGGPSSPTTMSTPVDIMQKLKMYIDSQTESMRIEAEAAKAAAATASQNKKEDVKDDPEIM